ncbi:hypothetical protein BGZ74_011461 [Mortierella antarctica]|nr:hypothetical protein BGZ74_011461 [Mortierella antarctica]
MVNHFAKLGQAVKWHVGGTDMIAKFRLFKKQESTNPFSLSVDDIADVRSGSDFAKTLDGNVGRSARVVKAAPDIFQRWPTLSSVCQRVFQWEDYDKVFEAVCKEKMEDPIARYLLTIVMAYSHYFEFRDEIPNDINEREGFGITTSFIRTAQTMYKVESRYQEVLITGVEERKNRNKDPRFEAKEAGRYADGVALDNSHQILISEAALIRRAKSEKRMEDEYKLLRAMRDSWMSQVRSICTESKPPQGIAVYGTASFMDETRLFRMDYQGAFRVQQFDAFFIPLRKKEFGTKMKEATLSCLRLGARLDQEIAYRRESKTSVPFEERDEMGHAMRCIMGTTATPTKAPKTPKKKI